MYTDHGVILVNDTLKKVKEKLRCRFLSMSQL